MTQRLRTAVVPAVVVVLCIVLGLPSTALAGWRATATSPDVSLSTGTLSAPVTTCTTRSAALGLASSAVISWPAVPGAASYTLTATNTVTGASQVMEKGVTATSFEVTGSLLTTLLAAVLSSLLAGGTVVITATAVDHDWQSVASNGQGVVLSGVVSGLLGGVKCAGT